MYRLLAFALLGSAAAFQPDDNDEFRNAVNACSDDMSDCTAADGTPIADWDVSGVTDMNALFFNKADANPDLSKWDVGQVTDMSYMFYWASTFDQDLSAWEVGKVTNMQAMFYYAQTFNGDLSAWNVGKVTDMQGMFLGASAFNRDLSAWDVGRVTGMQNMFEGASAFNQDLSAWDVGRVTDMWYMFSNAIAFNRQLCGAWVTSSTASDQMDTMFTGSSGGIATEECTLCPSGWKSIGEGNCEACATGTYSARDGQTICLACDDTTDAATCTDAQAEPEATQGCVLYQCSADELADAVRGNSEAYQKAGLCA